MEEEISGLVRSQSRARFEEKWIRLSKNFMGYRQDLIQEGLMQVGDYVRMTKRGSLEIQ